MNNKKFKCKWEKIDDAPEWVYKKGFAMNPGQVGIVKGRTFRYKIIRGWPRFQGNSPMTFYRRLRYSAWKRSQK